MITLDSDLTVAEILTANRIILIRITDCLSLAAQDHSRPILRNKEALGANHLGF